MSTVSDAMSFASVATFVEVTMPLTLYFQGLILGNTSYNFNYRQFQKNTAMPY
jgi:hypothetical protein